MEKLLIGIFTMLILGVRAAEWNVVASFDAAKADDLAKAGGATAYVYSIEEIPAAALPADSGERNIVFGNEISLAWAGMVAGAQYKLKATFLSDSGERVQQIKVNDLMLEEHLALPGRKVLEREWPIPAGALAAGTIAIAFQKIAGPNAVLSRLEVLSDHPQKLTPPPPLSEILATMDGPMPRLSPRPVAVAGVKTPLVSLGGSWKFNPAPPADFEKFSAAETKAWAKIEVPGEWVMQGFDVKTHSAAAYWREFEIPAGWRGQRIKLRFDTVHSDCRVFVNGREAGAHEGCFTAFELDITGAVKPGRNTLALAVKSESTADTLASATQYAAHQLGGITRKVQLFALPQVNLACQAVETKFDGNFENATLKLKFSVADEAAGIMSEPHSVRATLLDGNKIVASTTSAISVGDSEISIPVAAPKKWDSEHPNLYLLKTELLTDGKVTEEILQRVGFRQIEVRGNQLFVNGAPVKLRGACRHEVDPLRGRSLTPAI